MTETLKHCPFCGGRAAYAFPDPINAAIFQRRQELNIDIIRGFLKQYKYLKQEQEQNKDTEI